MFNQVIKNLIAISGILIMSATSFANQKVNVVGKAYSAVDDKLLYTEEHSYIDDSSHQVIYKEPDGSVFAVKELNYGQNASAPGFVQRNKRVGEVIEVNINNRVIESFYQKTPQNTPRVKQLDLESRNDEALVIDAGFDHFVRSKWENLQRGEKVDFFYLIPTRQRLVTLTIKRMDCREGPIPESDRTESASETSCFHIAPESLFLRMLVRPIYLTYDNRKHLQIFSGRSNIANAQGKYQDVSIYYQHLEDDNS